jgi:hypothetical protein
LGCCNGVGVGFPEAPKALHVFECKTANLKWFKTISKDGVKKAKPEHYAQMQVYMHGFRERGWDVSRAFYVVVCKDSDDIYVERVPYNKKEAEAFVHQAKVAVFSQDPLTKISDNPSWYQCKFCDFRPHCQLEKPESLQRNCRTCLSSTACADGTWFCEVKQETLSVERQRQGCEAHLFIPTLLPWELEDAYVERREVIYITRGGQRVIDGNKQLTFVEETDDRDQDQSG